jgi:hypothetical protein
MTKSLLIASGLLLLLGPFLSWHHSSWAAKVPDKPIWHGNSGGFAITWSETDIWASKPETPTNKIFSEHRISLKETAGMTRNPASSNYCAYVSQMKLLSVVGPYLSIRKEIYNDCRGAAHPQLFSIFETVNLTAPEKPVSLTQLFPQKEVLDALLQDRVVKKTLGFMRPEEAPKSLAELTRRLEEQSMEQGICEYRFTPDFLTHFTFHHLEENKVAVRISLPYGYEVCRGMLTELGILLPIPAGLKPSLEQANARKSGYLTTHLRQIAGQKQTTTIEF